MCKNFIKYLLYILPAAFVLYGCDSSTSSDLRDTGAESTGKGGSTARFTICGNYLCTVNNYDMRIFSLADPANPAALSKTNIGFGIETIFPRGDSLLFIGSQNGMYIYQIGSSGYPEQKSYFQHIKSCDPVVADSKYAYVTLNADHSWCGRTSNELQIIDISNIYNPNFVKSYPMFGPKGLGIDNKLLFVCDYGLKVYDVSDVNNIKLKKNFNISANDVIPYHGNLLVVGDDGFYQYKYQNDTITFLSKISKN
jgi:hypothetical protein